jgi:Cullin family
VKSANLLEVVDLGRDLFVKHIIRPPIKEHVISSILSLLHIERDGYVINRSAIMSCVDTLSKLSDSSDGMTVYKQYLEPEILSQTEAFYKAEAGRLLETYDTLEYLRRVNVLTLIIILTRLPYTRHTRFKYVFRRKSRASTSIYLYKPSHPSSLSSKIPSLHHTCKHSLTWLTRAWML